VKEIWAGVERVLGESVSRHSIKSYLHRGTYSWANGVGRKLRLSRTDGRRRRYQIRAAGRRLAHPPRMVQEVTDTGRCRSR
jgi:hypothetical protein